MSVKLRHASALAGLALVPVLLFSTACGDSDAPNRLNLPGLDVEEPPLPDVVNTGAAFGEPCVISGDCLSGFCSPAAEGGVCTDLCDEGGGCTDGFACETLGDVSVCVAETALTCQPCTADAECNLPGLSGNTCVDYGDEGSFCGLACDGDDACPEGFSCGEGQCVQDSGTCGCNGAGNALEMATTCGVTNEYGTCEGGRMCSTSGLTRCDAPEPAAETCNGVDDNCDGETDEGTAGTDCSITNEFGTCVGEVTCTEGAPICVGMAPAAEICDGVDNDCDGVTDEDQADLDLDNIPDCTDDDIDGDGSLNEDDCKPYNADIHPGATETCNGIDDNCNSAIDEGTDSDADDECGSYICGGPEGCRDDCYGNVHCTTDYKCDLTDDNDNGDSNECLPSVCGNGELEIQEVCDDGINDGGYNGCAADCKSVGPTCGDGFVDPEIETCDDGDDNGQPNKCNLTCSGITPSSCGNGALEAGEICDLGAELNSNSPDSTCRTDCTPQRCGDGVTDTEAGEECDAGLGNGETVCGCQSSCTFAPEAVSCRDSEGVCDIAEFCTGAGSCAADAFKSGETTCRASDGLCDAAEYCDGSTADCPDDAKHGAETTCRDADGLCDVAEVCTGDSDSCPADVIAAVGATCRSAAGLCDLAETCDGAVKTCPDDTFHPANIVCRDPAGLCDVAEQCSGEGAQCPDDAVAESGAICRDSASVCDVAETCDGSTTECPQDVVASDDTICREADGLCDHAEYCDGSTGGCPVDGFKPFGTECNASVGLCDPAETCPGNGPECPDDMIATAGTVCRDAADSCDVDEICDGEDTGCPDDRFEEAGTACDVGDGNCGSEPCECTDAHFCEQLCGNGRIDDHVGEVCEPTAGLGGAQDFCKDTCVGVCDLDAGWARQDGGDGPDSATDISVDENGTSWVVGTYRSAAQPAGPNLAPGLGDGSMFGDTWLPADYEEQSFLMVTDKDSNPRWAQCLGNDNSYGDVAAYGVAVDRHGSAYTVGWYSNSISFGCCSVEMDGQPQAPELCPSINEGLCGGSCGDSFLAKWDKDGNVVWYTHGGDPDDGGTLLYAVKVTPAGAAAVVGNSNDDVVWEDLWVEREASRASDDTDAFLMTFNRAGQPAWGHLFGGTGDDSLHGVAFDGVGNLLVAGISTDGNLSVEDFDLLDPADIGTPAGFIAKFGADGAPEWGWAARSSNLAAFIEVVVDGDGFVYGVGGGFDDADWGDDNMTAAAMIYVVKLDPEGNLVWFTPAQTDEGTVIDIDFDIDRRGRVTVVGAVSGDWMFGEQQLGSSMNGGEYNIAPFVARLDDKGAWMWAKAYTDGENGNAGFVSMDMDTYGGVWVTGEFEHNLTVDGTMFTARESDTYYAQYQDYSDVVTARLLGDSDCEQCGDGVVGPGESCDEVDGDNCAGTCDGICFGPANACGDGWVECGEDYDDGSGAAGEGMCMLAVGATWCFQDDQSAFTLASAGGGNDAMLGPGVDGQNADFGGNPDDPDVCPEGDNPQAIGARQWQGDMNDPNPENTSRLYCDGDMTTPPSGSSGNGTNDEAAAIECGDYYEFVASTGADVAFEFDEHSVTNGPTHWSVWVDAPGMEPTKVLEGEVTNLGAIDFGGGVDAPMHTAYLTGFDPISGVANQDDVVFRIYAWGGTAAGAPFVVDNVRVGPPRLQEPVGPTTVFINEIHYDNDSTDVDEGFEIAGPADQDLAGWSVVLYNGSNGEVYKTTNLDGSLSSGTTVGYAWFAVSGLQNGDPDGLALVDPVGNVVEFLSYEGNFTATEGVASGMASVDIGVAETSSTETGFSLQLTGAGCEIGSFTWTGPKSNTHNAASDGQTFVCGAP